MSDGPPGQVLDAAAADGLAVQVGDQEAPGRRRELVRLRRHAGRRIEAGLPALVELLDVRAQALARVGAGGIDVADLDRRGRQQALDGAHRVDEALAIALVEGFEQRRRELVAAAVKLGPLLAARARQAGDADAAIRSARLDPRHPVGLERPQQPAGVAGVQAEAVAQRPDLAAVLADLPQQARLRHRAMGGEEVVAQRADALRHRSVEMPDMVNPVIAHCLMLVRDR